MVSQESKERWLLASPLLVVVFVGLFAVLMVSGTFQNISFSQKLSTMGNAFTAKTETNTLSGQAITTKNDDGDGQFCTQLKELSEIQDKDACQDPYFIEHCGNDFC